MDADIIQRLVYQKKLLKADYLSASDKLEKLEGYRSYRIKRIQKKNGKSYYYVKPAGSREYKYIGKENKLVMRVKEAAHLEKASEVIRNDLELIESLIDGYISYDNDAISKMLPNAYRRELMLSDDPYRVAGERWKKIKLEYQKQFPENYPEKKTEETSDGVWVKSKNEVIIYERLLSSGLFFIYELPLVMKDYGPPLYPDFSILSPIDMKTVFIIEHVGKLNDWEYVKDFTKRVKRYVENGFKPGVNLFFSFSDKEGHLDSLQITKIIADIIGAR